jgi:UDP-galactopyranose mutase
MPEDGYTSIIANMLDHKAISTEMNRRISRDELEKFDHAFYSGPIDEFFDFKLGALRYRSLNFEKFYAEGDFQGNAVINYCDYNVPFTRITEHKHFAPWENHDRSVCYKEYSKVCEKGDIPYYPLGLEPDAQLYAQYKELAQTVRKVTFIGRLATYRYMDMHVCIAEALDLAEKFTGKRST